MSIIKVSLDKEMKDSSGSTPKTRKFGVKKESVGITVSKWSYGPDGIVMDERLAQDGLDESISVPGNER